MEIILDYLERFNVSTKVLFSEGGESVRGKDVMVEAEVGEM